MAKNTINSYKAKVGCWNCNSVYDILVKKGVFTQLHISDKNVKCRNCGCNAIRPIEDYRINKQIARDLVLQRRLDESMEPKNDIKNDHVHYK